MWRLKIGEGSGVDDPYLMSTNNFAGRQIWEFDPNAGTSEERVAVEETRRSFYDSRHRVKACGDLLWRMQVRVPYYYRLLFIVPYKIYVFLIFLQIYSTNHILFLFDSIFSSKNVFELYFFILFCLNYFHPNKTYRQGKNFKNVDL